jgi:TRAP-type C4-dicarboxylate transport system permease small subunit
MERHLESGRHKTAGGAVRPRIPAWVRAVRWCCSALAVLGSLVSVGIMLGMVADVTWRKTTGGSIPGMLELIETFMVVVVFLGLAYAETSGAHVRMNLVTRVLPFKVRCVVKAAGMGICAVVSGWMAWASIYRAVEATASGEVRPGLLYFPVWPSRIVIAVGFTLMMLEYVARVREDWLAQPTSAGATAEARR